MSVTINEPQKLDGLTWRLSWSSDLENPLFRIYQDGLRINTTRATQQDFSVSPNESLIVEILDTNDAPAQAFPGRFLLGWSPSPDAARYRIDEKVESIWIQRAIIEDSGKGFYSWKSRFLEDSTEHYFRVVPIGSNGNEGDALEMSEFMVRHPSPPDQNFSYSGATRQITITA